MAALENGPSGLTQLTVNLMFAARTVLWLATDPRIQEAGRKLEDAMTRDSPLLAKVGKPRT